MMRRAVLHCDLNNFYASCEVATNPELKGKPVAVSGNPEKRHGIILAKSELAKRAGVKTGEAIWQAQQKCGDLVLVPPHFELYSHYSKMVRDIYCQYTDRVESFGMDECWLDVTGSQKLFGTPEEIAYKIKEQVKRETGLTISVGVSWNKIFAKLGSDLKKPDAITVISPENFREKIWPLPATDLFMIGGRTGAKLKLLNIRTIGDLANADEKILSAHFGVLGPAMKRNANGGDGAEVMLSYESHLEKSMGNGTTMPVDAHTIAELKPVVYALAESVATRMRKKNFLAYGVAIAIKNTELHTITRQRVLKEPTDTAQVLAEVAMDLFNENYNLNTMLPVRMVSVSAYDFVRTTSPVQASMFDQKSEKQSRLEHSVDAIRSKYGYNSVKRGIIMGSFHCDNLYSDDENTIPFHRQ